MALFKTTDPNAMPSTMSSAAQMQAQLNQLGAATNTVYHTGGYATNAPLVTLSVIECENGYIAYLNGKQYIASTAEEMQDLFMKAMVIGKIKTA